MVYLPVLFQLAVFLLPRVQCRATVHLALRTPKPPKRAQHFFVTMTPLLHRPFPFAPYRLVLLLPKAIRSFSLLKLHLALNALSNPKFLLINRSLIFCDRFSSFGGEKQMNHPWMK